MNTEIKQDNQTPAMKQLKKVGRRIKDMQRDLDRLEKQVLRETDGLSLEDYEAYMHNEL